MAASAEAPRARAEVPELEAACSEESVEVGVAEMEVVVA